MSSSATATVTVADILELRASGLSEEESWALLCQSAQTLQDLFLSEELSSGEIVPLVTPQTLAITGKGRTVISFVRKVLPRHEFFLAPEYSSSSSSRRNFNSLDWEKMWVYSLGRTLLSALKDPFRTESFWVLKFMTVKDSTARASLMSLLNIISEHCQTNLPMKPFSHLVMEMYREVFGTPPQCLFPVEAPQSSSVLTRKVFPGESFCEHERPIFSLLKKTSTASSSGGSTVSSGNSCPIKRNPVQRAPSRLYRAPSGWTSGRFPAGRCVGPEFVVRGMEPMKVVHVGDVKASQRRAVTVILLTGQKIRVTCDPQSITCGKLFEILVQIEDIEDNYIFGLACMINGDFVFVPAETKLHKVAPSGWKEGGKDSKQLNFFLYVRVKFFLPSLRGFKSVQTKHLMYLQLRRSLLEQQIKCDLQELLTFGGLALQAEFGNFEEKEHGTSSYFLLEHYLPEELIEERTELESLLQEQHRSRRGLDPRLAEEIFVAQAQRLPEYGSHHYTALWVRKSVSIPMWVTVNPHGVYLYEKKKNVLDRKIHEAFVWKNIQGLTCNEHYFRLTPHDAFGQKATSYKLRMDSKKSFFLFRLASFHHQFFLKLRIELSPLHALSQEFGVSLKKVSKSSFYLERECETRGKSHPFGFREELEERQNKENENPEEVREEKKEKRTGVRMGVSAFQSAVADVSRRLSLVGTDAYVIDTSIRSEEDERFLYELQESLSSRLDSQWDQVSWQEERILRKVRLSKDKYGSFGLEIIEGGNGGLFVENVLKGRGKTEGEDEINIVQKGDQLLSVNGICLLNLNYSDALSVLKSAGSEIEILVSQSCRKEARQKPVEHEYLKNIRYETANEADNLESDLPLSNGMP